MAAVFSDRCEYPGLFVSLERCCRSSWSRRILGGRGRLAVPNIHVQDVVTLFRQLVDRAKRLDRAKVLIASPDEPVTMRERMSEEGVEWELRNRAMLERWRFRSLRTPGEASPSSRASRSQPGSLLA